MKYSLMTTSGLVDFPNTGSVFKSRIPPQWGGLSQSGFFYSDLIDFILLQMMLIGKTAFIYGYCRKGCKPVKKNLFSFFNISERFFIRDNSF